MKMKVVCIDIKYSLPSWMPGSIDNGGLTLNKSYDVIHYFFGNTKGYNYPNIYWYTILNDNNELMDYPSTRFIDIEDWRNKQLDKILND